ncbi:DUF763 domain-containing protein [archaeon]|nr:DUF763 domain-containing protein [archaeon]
MRRTGVAELPLHAGHVPAWLITRMIRLSRALIAVLVEEFGTEEVLLRLADPLWFQALSNVIGMDWDSSGSTTVTCGVLRQALADGELGILVAGGKGARSRRTPAELEEIGRQFGLGEDKIRELQRTSRLVAKVDHAAVQDGYQLYHHAMFVEREGRWAIVQQGMRPEQRVARRYHWVSERVVSFVVEPHTGVAGMRHSSILNMIARESQPVQELVLDLVTERKLAKDWARVAAAARGARPLIAYVEGEDLPQFRGRVIPELPRGVWERIYGAEPDTFEDLLLVPGVGPAVVRALALISELIYDTPPSRRDLVSHPFDPFRYSFAIGGKDGVPFPVDPKVVDEVIAQLEEAIEAARLGRKDKLRALERLRGLVRGWRYPSHLKRPT